MTRAEKLKLIREKYPNYESVLSQVELEDLIQELNDPEKLSSFRKTGYTQVLAGEVPLVGGALRGAKAVVDVAKTFGKKKTAEKVATETAKTGKKKSKVKTAVKGAVGLAGLATVANIAESIFGGDGEEGQDTTSTAVQDLQLATAMADAMNAGIDPNAVLATAAGQQVTSGTGMPDFSSVLQQWKQGGGFPTLTAGGVYIGKRTEEVPTAKSPDEARTMAAAGKAPVQTGTISEDAWMKMFPSDPTGLAAWKKRLIEAGVVSPSAGYAELKQQWEVWGRFSSDANKNGTQLTPYQLLDIQRGLWGGGGGNEPSYSVNLIKKENSRVLLRKYMEAETGRIISDEEADSFADLVRKKQLAKPTKTEVKKVKGKKVTVTTPGFGEAEAAKIAEQRAMQDPLYAEFQTANVFGTALEKALGVRG